MKSIVIQKPNELVIEERPLPAPAAGDVRVRPVLDLEEGPILPVRRRHRL